MTIRCVTPRRSLRNGGTLTEPQCIEIDGCCDNWHRLGNIAVHLWVLSRSIGRLDRNGSARFVFWRLGSNFDRLDSNRKRSLRPVSPRMFCLSPEQRSVQFLLLPLRPREQGRASWRCGSDRYRVSCLLKSHRRGLPWY